MFTVQTKRIVEPAWFFFFFANSGCEKKSPLAACATRWPSSLCWRAPAVEGTTSPLRPRQACMGGRAPWALTGAHLMDRGVNLVVGLGEIAPFLFTQTRAGLSPCLSGKQSIRLLLSYRETPSSYSVVEICCSFPLIISLSNTIVAFHVIFPLTPPDAVHSSCVLKKLPFTCSLFQNSPALADSDTVPL